MDTHVIIHPTDFSPSSKAALDFASQEAARSHCKLLIVHVADVEVPAPALAGSGFGGYPMAGSTLTPAEIDQRNEKLAMRLGGVKPTVDGIPYECRLLEGFPDAEIVQLAEDEDAEQIVLGSHGRTGLSRLIMGSVAESVVRHAPCPVTIVKATA